MPDDKQTSLELAVSLRTYFDAKLDALEKSQGLVYEAMGRRLDGLNQFREALRDQQSKFATCIELSAVRERLEVETTRFEKEIQVLREFKATIEGKASQQSVFLAYAISILGLLIGIIGLVRK